MGLNKKSIRLSILVIILIFSFIVNASFTYASTGVITAVNVQDFGAKGDGSTDDTNAIQAAINQVDANGGGTLFFPAVSSFYKITDTLTVTGLYNTELLGDGLTYILNFNTTGHDSLSIGSSSQIRNQYVTLRNLKIDSYNQLDGCGVIIFGITNMRIINCSFYNHGNIGISATNTYTMHIMDTQSVGNKVDGLYLWNAGGNNTLIERGKFNGNSSIGVFVDGVHYNVTIIGSDFEYNGVGIQLNQSKAFSVRDNYFEQNTTNDLLIPSGSTCMAGNISGNAFFGNVVIYNLNGGIIQGNWFNGSGTPLQLNNCTNVNNSNNAFQN